MSRSNRRLGDDLNRRYTVSVALTLLAVLSLPLLATAQEPAPPAVPAPAAPPAPPAPPTPPAITWNGFLSGAYSYNFSSPSNRTNAFRVFDFDDNSLKLDVAELVVQKAAANPGDSGFRVDLEAGSSIPRISSSSGLFRNSKTGEAQDFDLQQAFLSYVTHWGRGVRFDVGKFITHAGAEVIEGYDGYNDNYSRSFLFGYAIPFTHTGIKMTAPLNEHLTGMLMLANGWDNATDNNRGKTLGAQLVATPSPKFTAYINYIGGPEKTDSNDMRHLLDVVGVWKATPALTLSVNADFAREEGDLADGGSARWSGVAAYARYDVSPRFSLGLRGEVFDDKDGVRTGTAGKLSEGTITPTWHVDDHLSFRGDLRFDHADSDVLGDDQDPKSHQVTTAVNAIYTF